MKARNIKMKVNSIIVHKQNTKTNLKKTKKN